MNATSLIVSLVTLPPTFRTTIGSLRLRPRKCAGSTRGSRHVITNRRRLGKTTAPSWPPAAAKARLRSSAGSTLAVVIELLMPGSPDVVARYIRTIYHAAAWHQPQHQRPVRPS